MGFEVEDKRLIILSESGLIDIFNHLIRFKVYRNPWRTHAEKAELFKKNNFSGTQSNVEGLRIQKHGSAALVFMDSVAQEVPIEME